MGKTWDWLLFSQILAIGAISLLVIFSINKNLAQSQAIFWVVGFLILAIFSRFNFQSWQRLSYGFYFATILALFLLLFIGTPVRGSIRWIDLGVFTFQPSEIAKVGAILALSTFYFERSARRLKNLFLSFLIVLPSVILLIIQPDIGDALVFLAIWLGISIAAGLKVRYLLILLLVGFIVLPIFYQILSPYQKQRISSFLNPNIDPLGINYNVIQSRIAVGSGEFFGKGLGLGSQSQLKFLPEAERDFIFASLAEQLGFLGAGLMLALFTWLLLRLTGFVKNTDRFGQLVIAGTVSFILFQLTINVGMNMAILPVTGITLPFVSYGGSSLLSTLFLISIIQSIKKD